MRVWVGQQARALRTTAARLTRSPLATLFNVAVVGIALALPATLYVALFNLQNAALAAAPKPQLSIFMDTAAQAAEVREIEARLKRHPLVAQVRFVSRERALDDMKRLSGIGSIAEALGQNPLPDAFVVDSSDLTPETMQKLRDEFATWPKVALVQLDAVWAQRLAAVLRLGRVALLLLGALLAFALVAVTFNTIRLQILTQREEIEVASLIGATRRFIRRPFLYYGALLGLLGGFAAWGLVWATTVALDHALADLARLYGTSWRLQPLSARDAVALLGFAAALGWLGAWLSVSRHFVGGATA